MHEKKIRSRAGLALVARVRKMVGELPGVSEEIDKFGHTSFRVAKKPFVIIGENEDELGMSIKADVETQAMLIRDGRYERTPYIGQHGWVSLADTKKADWAEVEELALEAYRRVAPRRKTRGQ
jgi:predicted DNA-binding protein (MmcQ/YjbR family)